MSWNQELTSFFLSIVTMISTNTWGSWSSIDPVFPFTIKSKNKSFFSIPFWVEWSYNNNYYYYCLSLLIRSSLFSHNGLMVLWNELVLYTFSKVYITYNSDCVLKIDNIIHYCNFLYSGVSWIFLSSSYSLMLDWGLVKDWSQLPNAAGRRQY